MSSKRRKRITSLLLWPGLCAFVALFLLLPELFPGNSQLYQAIIDGDEAKAHSLLEAGADPNSRAAGLSGLGGGPESTDRYQFPPLLYAIWHNEPGIALLLVEAGADPNARNPEGDTALIAAANAGMTEVVKALIDKRADVQATNTFNGETPLHLGPAFDVLNTPNPKDFLEPEIKALLEQAGAK
ncbi:MAG: ankyrin repeat domain-containing protein [Anaerolineae bacterium]|nr:ankyrin repeat domain-containing protein [Anaerolineae bacterium]MCB0181411.1 ankyrin repeat domain-containing protein [Anaerolineae bacterium]MCB9109601.1 ankyrin repeat domain-containing protein [Anaerolineales bacterium]